MPTQKSKNQEGQRGFCLSFEQILSSAIPTALAAPGFLPPYLQAVCDRAMDGDPAAIEVILRQTAKLTYYCAVLASNAKFEAYIRQIVEGMVGVPVLKSVSPGLEAYVRNSFSQFDIGKNSPAVLQGKWDYTNPASRAMVQVVFLMDIHRKSATSKREAGEKLDPLEILCADLPSTKGRVRARSCKVWRDRFIDFWGKAHATGRLNHALLNEPDLKGYHGRGTTAMAGIKARVLRFLQDHLEV